VVRVLDTLLLPLLLKQDKDVLRSTLYGKPGAMRIKPYGVEWRTPSNVWLNNRVTAEAIASAVLAITKKVVDGSPSDVISRIAKQDGYEEWSTNDLLQAYSWFDIQETLKNFSVQLLKSASPVPIGTRIASSSSQVGYDLNLDIDNGVGYSSTSSVYASSNHAIRSIFGGAV
jgi:hypothetical protein